MRQYGVNGGHPLVAVSDLVIDHFHQHRQTRLWHREAGGLLFARLDAAGISIELATGPRQTDRRCRYSYRPDRQAEQREIDDNHRRGLHFVGTWHTHPEDHPKPSSVDMNSMADIFMKSQHALNGFCLFIVGRVITRHGLFASIWDGDALHELAALKDEA